MPEGFGARLAAAVDDLGLDAWGVFHRTNIRPRRLQELGQDEGTPVTEGEAIMLAQLLCTTPEAVMKWAAPRPAGPLVDELTLHAFLGLTGSGRRLNVGAPWRAPAPAHLAASTWAWAIVQEDDMAAAGIEAGSRVFVQRPNPETLHDRAIVLAQGPAGAVCRRLVCSPQGDFLVREPKGGQSPSAPDEVGPGLRVVGVVTSARRPDLSL